MNRREFLKSLFWGCVGVAAAPTVINHLAKVPETPKSAIAGFTGKQWLESGIVYAPYIPLYCTNEINLCNFSHEQLIKMYSKPRPFNGRINFHDFSSKQIQAYSELKFNRYLYWKRITAGKPIQSSSVISC